MEVVRYVFLFSIFVLSVQAKTVKDIKELSPQSSAITYQLNGGRFGDNLLSYSRVKWLSYVNDIPVLYFPFPYADQLALHVKDAMYEDGAEQEFAYMKNVDLKSKTVLKKNSDTLYICHWESGVKIDWNDKVFVEGLKECISPLNEYQKVTIPEGYISVAVHVRTGGGYAGDHAIEKARAPLRFVPEEFFIEQLGRVVEAFPDQKLYVHVFTDHPQPKELAKKFARALNNKLVTFGYRDEGNSYKANVLDDFFAMMEFTCLIRPGSNFSRFVERLGNAQFVIYPESARKVSDTLSIIDKIRIKTKTEKGWKTRIEVIA